MVSEVNPRMYAEVVQLSTASLRILCSRKQKKAFVGGKSLRFEMAVPRRLVRRQLPASVGVLLACQPVQWNLWLKVIELHFQQAYFFLVISSEVTEEMGI